MPGPGRLPWLIVFAAVVVLAPRMAAAQGGPPILTDDPDTPGPGHWEINIASEIESDANGHRVEAPALDVNYGAGRRVQLKVEMPWVNVRDGGDTSAHGMGNLNTGVKWRFLGGEHERVSWSTYPQVELHTSPVAIDDLPGNARPIVHLPTELTVRIVHMEINGEVGRSFVSGGDDHWFGGVSTEAEMPRLEIVGELHEDKARGAPSTAMANLGARPRLTPQIWLLVAAGRTLHAGHLAPPLHRYYLGLQFNLPRRREDEPLLPIR